MKNWLLLSLLALLASCNNKKVPDVSGIKADLQVQRFEQDFFAIDTNNIGMSMLRLQQKYPLFLNDFLVNILGIPLVIGNDTAASAVVKKFIRDYKPIKDTADKVFSASTIAAVEKEVKRGLQFAKHYFPGYQPPTKLITFIGPMDAY